MVPPAKREARKIAPKDFLHGGGCHEVTGGVL